MAGLQLNLSLNSTNAVLNYTATNPIITYCNDSLTNLIGLAIAVFILWILEPKIRKSINELDIEDGFFISKSTLIFMYKWISLGLFFMLIYMLMIFRKCIGVC